MQRDILFGDDEIGDEIGDEIKRRAARWVSTCEKRIGDVGWGGAELQWHTVMREREREK